jgi:hypothetical protein
MAYILECQHSSVTAFVSHFCSCRAQNNVAFQVHIRCSSFTLLDKYRDKLIIKANADDEINCNNQKYQENKQKPKKH